MLERILVDRIEGLAQRIARLEAKNEDLYDKAAADNAARQMLELKLTALERVVQYYAEERTVPVTVNGGGGGRTGHPDNRRVEAARDRRRDRHAAAVDLNRAAANALQALLGE